MFSREGSYRDVVACPVHLVLSDGTLVKGHLERSRNKTLADVLNDSAAFIEITHFDGTKAMYNKQTIRSCGPKEIPSVDQLKLATLRTDLYSPLAILGLDTTATRPAVREAYLKLAKKYHPDRYESSNLPDEVLDYIQNVSRRINLAYEEALEQIGADARVGA